MKILPDYPSLRGLVIAALVVTVALYFFGGGIETMVAAKDAAFNINLPSSVSLWGHKWGH